MGRSFRRVVPRLLPVEAHLLPEALRPSDLEAFAKRGGTRIEATTSQGHQVAFYLPSRKAPSQPPEFLWLVFGGNGALALDYAPEAASWDARFGYLFVDYPGYGLCEGRPNPERIEESTLALTEKLRSELHWSDADLRARCGVIGHSLGCAAGLIAADRLELQRLVLCAPFTTMTDMARRVIGWPLCHLNRHRFDNIARLTTIIPRGAQVRVFHGRDDEVIPVLHGPQDRGDVSRGCAPHGSAALRAQRSRADREP